MPVSIATELLNQRYKRAGASFGTNEELTNLIIDYLQRFVLDKVVIPVSATTRNWILGIIEQGIQAGEGAYEIAGRISGSDFLKFQALRIVRTETVRATNVGAMKAAEASPFELQKEWISANDHRVRHSHVLVDGQVVDFDQKFTNGLLQPGDPNGSAEETINCRCSVSFIPKRDADGRLMVKPVDAPIFNINPEFEKPSWMRRVMNFLNVG